VTYGPGTAEGLLAEVERYQRADHLSPEAFAQYIGSETELGVMLSDLAAQQETNLEFIEARATYDRLTALNQTTLELVDRELSKPEPIDPEFRRQLLSCRTDAQEIILYATGQGLVNDAVRHQMSGDIETAIRILRQARDRFAELATSDTSLGGLGNLRRILTDANIEFYTALREFRCSRYDGARDACQHVLAILGQLLEEANAELEGEDRPDPQLLDLQRGLSDQYTYAQAFVSLTGVFTQIHSGDYEKAVEYATDAVRLGEEWLRTIVSQGLPQVMQNLRRMELEQYRGWLGLANAEYAVDQRRWDECREYVRQAQEHWNTSIDYLLRYQLIAAYSPTDVPNIDLLLRATLRRCKREEALWAEIDRLREEKRQAGNVSVHAYGGNSMTSGDSINIHGDVAAGAIGPNAHVTGSTISSHHEETAGLEVVAGQLADLAEAMKAGGGMTDAERTSIEQVTLAGEAARSGNESAMRAHLRAAGQWAAAVAKQLALTAAEAAIKASIGG